MMIVAVASGKGGTGKSGRPQEEKILLPGGSKLARKSADARFCSIKSG